MSNLGGVYLKTYDNMRFVSSSVLSAWSDHSDGCENKPTYWTAAEYISYCENFAQKYDLMKHIHFCCKIEEVKKCQTSGKWMVTILKRSEVEDDCDLLFDSIAVCSGANNIPVIPNFIGESRFKGEIIHSNEYINPLKYTGKRVLIIGSGESAADIMNEVSNVALKTAIVIRGKHGHIIPRYQGDSNNITDLNTNRCRYSNSYIFGDIIGYVTQWCKYFISKCTFKTDATRIISKISEMNMMQKTSAFSKYGCKSSGFVEAIVLRNAELFRSNIELFDNKVVFEDGSQFECDTIIACTGYKCSFPFFDNHHPEISNTGMNPRMNYKQIFNVEYGNEIAFIGFVRPAFGAITSIIEMQSRFYSYVINGEIVLPLKEEQELTIMSDKECWSLRFKYDVIRIKSIVDYQLYCDSLAKLMNVMPDLWNIFFKSPYLWSKIMFGPLTMHQYRLTGRHSDIKRATEIILKQPYGDLLESVITAFFLIITKVINI